MKRREFIAGMAAAAWPLASRAEPAQPVVGFLHSASQQPNANQVTAFRKGLSDAGFVVGRNVAMEFRWANGQVSQLPALAKDLVGRKVAVIATPGSTPATLAAKAATTTIPIVFATGGNPVALGFAASLNRPGGNLTGISFETVAVVAKSFAILHEMLPQAARVAVIVNPDTAFTPSVVKSLQEAAATLKVQIDVFHAGTDREIEDAFARIAQRPGTPVLFGPDAFYTNRRSHIVALAAHYALPVMYVLREFTEAGGLISYGPDITNAYREAGSYTGRILKGEKAAQMPVVLPTKFDFVINLKTAKAQRIVLPDKLLALADEVIE